MKEIINILKKINNTIDYEKEINMVERGLFSSFDILQCITEIEEEFDIQIPPEYINHDNFSSAQNIHKMIENIKSKI
ncbi:hypothetical protein CPIN18021_1669 [Campylobacter pinnipediorum subsp. caledonicus]|uniref:Uncharacterized protein n=1 Tax=Campylobacter pinnipediorum subsp. caledonicus TaxID=1874362 RepID=A0A1S6UAH2_9BACT|nr:hypothetical protein [Campylobacter pinnipediorum]AQW86792.1 hypothetical protein CPIN18020_1615 [Campylobacter pinnipediorum subsp. caledonicus]AQW88447.1 hypothetical protein CPIN18021_1669 [Campylobacter pinnipediorum subsp. caledonicus]OPA72588.1 hypothetical protein BB381_05155 [Campylobacter pinnipediorum subsp. caledonicus]